MAAVARRCGRQERRSGTRGTRLSGQCSLTQTPDPTPKTKTQDPRHQTPDTRPCTLHTASYTLRYALLTEIKPEAVCRGHSCFRMTVPLRTPTACASLALAGDEEAQTRPGAAQMFCQCVNKDFASAIAHYSEAIEASDSDAR
eukprot:241308-Rhodomonas_salina.1